MILPAVVDVAPVLVPVTALCWVLLMVGAMITHGCVGPLRPLVLHRMTGMSSTSPSATPRPAAGTEDGRRRWLSLAERTRRRGCV
ncbi:hypothetical protein [Nonomuraea guangzhouensis]|uniref:Secreted protein n=1 Tax=Nonomuraea guangzhouensis TaxID=1291555 RepID=A0ABW4GLN0_9ACTN